MRLLLEHGADVDAQVKGRKNWAALHQASAWGKSQVVRVLLEHGANVDIEDADGKTPSQLAAEKGRLEVVELLAKHGSEPKT
jgi:tankyrase